MHASAYMRLTLALAATACLALAGSAQAQTPLDMPDGPAKTLYQSWVDASALPTPTEPVAVELRQWGPGTLAGTHPAGVVGDATTIAIPDLTYLADTAIYGEREIAAIHGLFMHELAHAVDFERQGRGGYRREFWRLAGRADWGWWSGDAERFADAYAFCATSPHTMPRDHLYAGYGTYRPTDKQHRRVCHMLDVRLDASPPPLPKRKRGVCQRRSGRTVTGGGEISSAGCKPGRRVVRGGGEVVL